MTMFTSILATILLLLPCTTYASPSLRMAKRNAPTGPFGNCLVPSKRKDILYDMDAASTNTVCQARKDAHYESGTDDKVKSSFSVCVDQSITCDNWTKAVAEFATACSAARPGALGSVCLFDPKSDTGFVCIDNGCIKTGECFANDCVPGQWEKNHPKSDDGDHIRQEKGDPKKGGKGSSKKEGDGSSKKGGKGSSKKEGDGSSKKGGKGSSKKEGDGSSKKGGEGSS